jgi:hypothetical protein
MVMFKAKFEPASDKPQARDKPPARARAQQQQQPQPQSPPPKVPPIEEERGPQHPIELPGEPHEPERAW